MGRFTDRQEAHVLKLAMLGLEAKAMVDQVWERITEEVATTQMARVFDLVVGAAGEIVGVKGQEAIDESVRYQRVQLGFEPNKVMIGDLGQTVQDFLAEIEEHGRHAQELIAIRSRRMKGRGVAIDVLTQVLKQDFQHGGEMFGVFKNAVKRSVEGAVIQMGKEAEHAALRPKRVKAA